MLSSDTIVRHAPMHLRLELKKRCELFWLKDIRDVDISQCCAKCFIGQKDNRVYYASSVSTTRTSGTRPTVNPRGLSTCS